LLYQYATEAPVCRIINATEEADFIRKIDLSQSRRDTDCVPFRSRAREM
jgi:hypothetical protein